MPKEKKSKSSQSASSGPAKAPRTKAGAREELGEAFLEDKVLETLKKRTAEKGLTLGDLVEKCGAVWRRELASKLGLKKSEAKSADAQGFTYDLWRRGLLFTEPPEQGKRSARIWAMEHARVKFPLVCAAPEPQTAHQSTLTEKSLKTAYDKFVPEHLGGFVPIFKVRRELAAPREDFDNLLKQLNELDEPVLELHGGDPQVYTDDQKQDSLRRGENLFLRMRWREQ